jgi:hypothetical protein
MNMKRLASGIIAIALSCTAQSAFSKCSYSDLYGTWLVKYRFSKPQQVGGCLYTFDPVKGFYGNCANLTYGLYFTFFDGGFSLNSACKLNATIILDDGSLNKASGTLRPATGTASGTLKATTYGRTLNGTFSMVKQ